MAIDRTRFAHLDGMLRGRELVVVSNREPYSHHRGPAGPVASRPAGGLVAALDPVLQLTGGTWVAWGDGDADFDVTDGAGRVRVPAGVERYTLRRVALTQPEVDGYYYGYANQVLWPLCHTALDRVRVRRRAWETYQAVNRRFAEAVAAEARRDALVWLHDYHLAACPLPLREARPDLFLMHFWHVPWPAWDVFRVCPQRADLLRGLLGNDLIGFQRRSHLEHFVDCVARELGVRAEDDVLRYGGRRIRVEALPISVDVSALDERARSERCDRWTAGLARLLGLDGRRVVLSVDRLDYTKGILERLRTIDQFFTRYPEYRARVVFVQKLAPSRTRIKAYRDLQAAVEERIARLNAAHGTRVWQPLVYLPDPLPPAGMAALYRMADACAVTSLQDGMNLVAKEFVACQADGRGVLLLSELAGAHEEMAGALSLNPYDAEACAAAVARALEMPAAERRMRMDHLRAHLISHDVYHWMAKHLEAAARMLSGRTAARVRSETAAAIAVAAGGRPLALLLDFDGTLAPFEDHPGSVELAPALRAVLGRLAASRDVAVALVSGRSLADLRLRVGLDRVVYAGNHGLEISGPGWSWVLPEAERTRGVIEACGRQLRARLRDLPGAWVEDKGLTLTVHYRRTSQTLVGRVRDAVFEECARISSGEVAVHRGTRALEVRPAVSWHKGAAAQKILAVAFGDAWRAEAAVVCFGDDWTDEDAFLALPEPAVTVKVGDRPGQTAARYRVGSVEDVHLLLGALADERAPRVLRPEDARADAQIIATRHAGRLPLAGGVVPWPSRAPA